MLQLGHPKANNSIKAFWEDLKRKISGSCLIESSLILFYF